MSLRRDAEANRARLVEAAEQVFAERGVNASLEDVARAAGIGAATLYRRFGTKQALVREVLQVFFGQLLELAEAALAEPPERCLDVYLETVGYELAAKRGFLHGMWGELAPAAVIAELETRTEQLLDRAKNGGGIDEQLTVGDIAAVVWALRGIIHTSEQASPGTWRRHLTFVLAGFRA